jgi:hypothetical protein
MCDGAGAKWFPVEDKRRSKTLKLVCRVCGDVKVAKLPDTSSILKGGS